jgi:putative lipoic acid-binding regulatory protein/uncharacterized RDD family membrane protein YckC
MRRPSTRGVAPAGPKRYRGEEVEPKPQEPVTAEAQGPTEEAGERASEHRAFMGARLLASFLDVALIGGATSLLLLSLSALFDSSLKAYGFKLNGVMILLPVVVLYFSYFSSEAFSGKSLGKVLMGIEIRKDSGLPAREDMLLRRFLVKHLPALFILGSSVFESAAINLLALAALAFYMISAAMGFSPSRLCVHDLASALAVFPKRVPAVNLNHLTPGKTKEEVDAELAKLKRERERNGKQGRAPSAATFPCAVELKIYAHPREGIGEELLECFSRFVPEVHPRQIRESLARGTYATFKVIMRFEEPLQMEASYEAVQRVKGVVTVLPLKSVRLAKGSPAVQPTFKEDKASALEDAEPTGRVPLFRQGQLNQGELG